MRRRAAVLGGIALCGLFFAVMRPPASRFGEDLSLEAFERLARPAAAPGGMSSAHFAPAVVYVHAEWCADCAAFEARLRKPDAASALKRFHRYQFDATSESVWPFLVGAGIQSVPALFIVDGTRRRALASYSRMPAEALLGFLDGRP